MKIIKNTIATLILFSVISFAQQEAKEQTEDLQKVKDALVNSTLYVQELQKQNNELNIILQRVANDLKNVKTIMQLDSLKKAYGIVSEEPKKNQRNK